MSDVAESLANLWIFLAIVGAAYSAILAVLNAAQQNYRHARRYGVALIVAVHVIVILVTLAH